MTDDLPRTVDPLVKVARDLREIERLAGELEAQAIADASHPLMPGGRAMVALAPVASPEAWENLEQATERALSGVAGYSKAYTSAEDEDPEEAWPAFQLLRFWSEAWRRERDADYDQRVTLVSEASFLRHSLEWAWDNELGFSDFERDIAKARRKLEDILRDGDRAELGVPCLYDECRGKRIRRTLKLVGGKWQHTDWYCPGCRRSWAEDEYVRMVYAAHEATKVEDVGGEMWCAVDVAARLTGRSAKTIRTWINRSEIATLCIVVGKREPFVRLDEVRERHEGAARRAS